MALNVRRRRAAETVLGLVLLGAAVGLVNGVAQQHPLRFDLTADGRYTLAPATRSLLEELGSPLEIRAFVHSQAPAPWSDAVSALTDLLDGVRVESPQVRLFVQDTAEPGPAAEARQLGLTPVDFGLRGGEAFLGAVLLYQDEKAVVPPTVVPADLEFELARGLREVLRPDARKPLIFFSQGHGEPDLVGSPLAHRLRASGDLENIELGGTLLPVRGDALVILAPSRPFDARARYLVDQFLLEGKTVLAFVDYRPRSTVFPDLLVPTESGLEPLFAHLGMTVDTQYTVLDRVRAQPTPVSQADDGRIVRALHPLFVGTTALMARHPVTRGLRSLTVPLAAPIRTAPGVEILVASEPTAVGRKNLTTFAAAGLEKVVSEPGVEVAGPFPMGAVAQGVFSSLFPDPPPPPDGAPADPPPIEEGRGTGRLLVMTSGRRFLAAGEDAQLFLANAVDWAVTTSDLADLRARAATDPPLRPLSASARTWIRAGSVLGPPLALLLFGALRAIWMRRRRR